MSDDDSFIDRMNDAYYSIVDRVINLSTGALALSITFRNAFSQPKPTAIWILKLSWISFTIAIVAALILLYGRVEVNRRTARIYKALFQMTPDQLAKIKDGIIVPPAKWFAVAKPIMSISFAVGIIALAVYAIKNLP